jgi:hypothetical protein
VCEASGGRKSTPRLFHKCPWAFFGRQPVYPSLKDMVSDKPTCPHAPNTDWTGETS